MTVFSMLVPLLFLDANFFAARMSGIVMCVLLTMAVFSASAQQQPAPPSTEDNAKAAIKAQAPRSSNPPVQPPRSNGSTGWVISTKPAHISLADIPAMFPAR